MSNEAIKFPITGYDDGDSGDSSLIEMINIMPVENGFILSLFYEDGLELKEVYSFEGKGKIGALGLMQSLINSLELNNKISIKEK